MPRYAVAKSDIFSKWRVKIHCLRVLHLLVMFFENIDECMVSFDSELIASFLVSCSLHDQQLTESLTFFRCQMVILCAPMGVLFKKQTQKSPEN